MDAAKGLCCSPADRHNLAAGMWSIRAAEYFQRGIRSAPPGIVPIFEIVEQLRGRAGTRQAQSARVGLTENGGGFLDRDATAVSIHILSV